MKYQLKYYSRELLYIVIQYDNCDERERERVGGWVCRRMNRGKGSFQ